MKRRLQKAARVILPVVQITAIFLIAGSYDLLEVRCIKPEGEAIDSFTTSRK